MIEATPPLIIDIGGMAQRPSVSKASGVLLATNHREAANNPPLSKR